MIDRVNDERAQNRRALALALGITAAVLVAEVAGGILTGSLALLADAGHMGSDAGALALSLGALWLASRPATASRTYGFQRAEVLAALINSLALGVIAAFVFWEAGRRLSDPPDVETGPMLAVAAVGLAANLAAAFLLFGQSRRSINVRSAFLHVMGDVLASVGVIIAGLIMLASGNFLADPIVSVVIGVLILLSSLRIAWESTQVLLEATPRGLRVAEVQSAILKVPGVHDLHDLHVWTVTSGFVSLSAHVETDQSRNQHDILVELRVLLSRRFGIEHATLQLETAALHEELESCCGVDTKEGIGRHAVHHT